MTIVTEPKRRKIPWTWIITIGLAVVLLYFAFRGIDWNAMLAYVQQARIEFLLAAASVLIVSYLIRALRWRVLLSAEKWLPPLTVFWGTFVGYLGNSVLPARAGELIRTVMITRAGKLNFGFVLATALIERVMDAGVLVLIVLVSLSTLENLPDWLVGGSRTMAIIAIVGIVGLLVAPHLEGFIRQILGRLPLPENLRGKLDAFVGRFLTGMKALQHPGRAAGFAVFTVLAWSVDVVIAMLVGQAFGMALTVPQTLLLLAALGLASAAPSTPGYIGVYQFVARTVLVPFGYVEEQVLAFILTFQAVSYVMVILVGGIGLWQLNAGSLNLTKIVQEGERPAAE